MKSLEKIFTFNRVWIELNNKRELKPESYRVTIIGYDHKFQT